CATEDEAADCAERFGGKVVMKILSPDILHKSEIGGVLLGIVGGPAAREGFRTLVQRAATAAPTARINGVLVAKQLEGGVECIMGIQRDPVFGPVALVGIGGIFVEILQDVALHRCPFGPEVAERMIRSLRAAPILLGARGKPPADLPALATMLSRLSQWAGAAGDRLQSVDLNPVLALPDGAYALDAVIEVQP
ncbi:MAG: acetate--CoA ligase family protein, partial [Acetobacteraceae bacterium]|nr:acetate--CoA ligase family protein [Acetobacteraceae bacterium]